MAKVLNGAEAVNHVLAFLKSAGVYSGPFDGRIGPGAYAGLKVLKDRLDALPATTGGPVDPNDRVLIRELERDEGRVPHAYTDSLGYLTIGIGRLIDKRRGGGLSDSEIDYLKANDIARVKRELDQNLPWWRNLDPVRQRVVQNVAFNLGVTGLVTKWPNTVALIKAGRYAEAGRAMRDNGVWIGQVKDRGRRLATMMETGRAV